MTVSAWVRRRLAKAALLALTLLAALALWFRHLDQHLGARPPEHRPTLLLLSSLPLVFPESFNLDKAGSPALTRLQGRYRMVPIAVADPANLGRGQLLLMAQAFAQPPESLVALDSWVRRGGRAVLLADPLLEWRSEQPLGSPLRPAPMFPDTGLLRHWGLDLEAPAQRGPAKRKIGGFDVMTISPGSLSGLSRTCAISGDRLVARCRLGKGQATIIADADFLISDDSEWQSANVDGLIAELAAIEPKSS